MMQSVSEQAPADRVQQAHMKPKSSFREEGCSLNASSTRAARTAHHVLSGFAVVSMWMTLLMLGERVRAETWSEALATMPLKAEVHHLDRLNCVDVMLSAFQSNNVVKGLIFMPGATDEFYMFRRAQADLAGSHLSVLDAVVALTNQTRIRALFRPPLLLLHTEEDPLEPQTAVEDERTASVLKSSRELPRIWCNDRDWDYVQPKLRWALKMDIRPWQKSVDSWHFYRHSFAAWNLTGWEALEATAFAGKSRFTVRRNSVVFEVDRRVLVSPRF